MDADKFWFALLFIKDYVDGESWQVSERGKSPADEVKQLLETISQYEEAPNANPLTEHITFNQELTLSLQLNGKIIHKIATANAIKFTLIPQHYYKIFFLST